PAGAYLAGEVHVRGDDVDPGAALLEGDRGAGRVGEAVHAGAFTGPLPVETLPLPQHDDGAAARRAVVDGRSAGHVRGAGDLLHVGLDDDDVVRHDLAFGVGVHRRLPVLRPPVRPRALVIGVRDAARPDVRDGEGLPRRGGRVRERVVLQRGDV